MTKLWEQMNKLTFADIEMGTNLSERHAKQLMKFINQYFDVNGFFINYNEEFDEIIININELVSNSKIQITISKSRIFGKIIFILKIDDKIGKLELGNSFLKNNLYKTFDELYNNILSEQIEY